MGTECPHKGVVAETEGGYGVRPKPLGLSLVEEEGTLTEVKGPVREGTPGESVVLGLRGPGPEVGVCVWSQTVGGPEGRGPSE